MRSALNGGRGGTPRPQNAQDDECDRGNRNDDRPKGGDGPEYGPNREKRSGEPPGASARKQACEACSVIGVDLSAANVEVATVRAAEAGLDGRVRFVRGDAEALPLPPGSVDGAICECSLCLIPDKDAAARELARVLRPGARLALTDVTAVSAALPPELRTLSSWIACVADARPLLEIASLFEGAGFVVEELEQRDELLAELIERVDGRLRLASFLHDGIPEPLRQGLAGALDLMAAARTAVERGDLGYGILEATRA